MALHAQIIAVDMPIGLPERSGRAPEREVRARLGERQSSVFAVPAEKAVYCAEYPEACRVNLLHSDPPKKVSKQCFHLFPKMREIDGLIAPRHQSRIFESHPEVAFCRLNGDQAMQLPTQMFPVLFAIPRTVGWLAQWVELLNDPEQKIARPRQVYTGSPARDYTAIERRK